MRQRKRGEIMLDIKKLKGKITENGKNVKTVSEEIGIDPGTFYRKMNNNSFKISEADAIISVLGLSGSEAMSIFFADYVA
jgi:hypothetical protein